MTEMAKQSPPHTSIGRSSMDMPWEEIMEVEKEAYPPEQQASLEKLQSRYAVFPDGFLLAYRDGRLAGFATCQIVNYRPSLLGRNWNEWTDDGCIRKSHDQTGNALFG